MAEVGLVYLLHFDPPIRHASHYVGWTTKTADERFAEHLSGAGSPLVRTAAARRSSVQLVRTWPNATRSDERAIKDGKNARQFCPLCLPDYRKTCAARMRRIRAQKKDRARRLAEWVAGSQDHRQPPYSPRLVGGIN